MLTDQDIQKIKDAFQPNFEAIDKRFDKIEQRLDNLEKKVDSNHQEFLEFKRKSVIFQDYVKEMFTTIQYRIETTYLENRSRIERIERSLQQVYSLISIPK